jgi:hypothetical protein
MPKRYVPADTLSIINGLVKETDRAAILIGGSWLEWFLEGLIGAVLRAPKSSDELALLFTENGLFGSFSEKINGAYFLKLIGPETRRQLHIIRTIRNEAAHNMNQLNFSSESVANRCRELKFIEWLAEDSEILNDVLNSIADGADKSWPKVRFITAVSFISAQAVVATQKRKLTPEQWEARIVSAEALEIKKIVLGEHINR